MATPATFTANVTPLSAANLNKAIAGDGTKVQIKVWYGVVVYNGSSALVISSDHDACGLQSSLVNYDNSTHQVTLSIAGFVNPPVVLLNRLSRTTGYIPAQAAGSNTEIIIEYYDPSDLTVLKTASSANVDMAFSVLLIGY